MADVSLSHKPDGKAHRDFVEGKLESLFADLSLNEIAKAIAKSFMKSGE